ncbi:MAG: rRNA pseudouridine synthase [Planctomycetaceae bacterium]|nr:rRNA pseudouridine synthase [Planctomycetaceae bacterium]
MTESVSEPQPRLVRLQRYLASCGLGSRRACEEFILAGRVSIDGKTVTELGTKVDPQSQSVALDGEALRMERKKYYLLNKPTGVLSTNRDPEGRTRVIDLFPENSPRLFTVGRLDEDSEGLLIVTNDGDLAQKLAHPKFQVLRTYQMLVAGIPTGETLGQLKRGLHFAEGKFRVREAYIVKVQGKSSLLEVVLSEGHNRELRRLLARVGHKVMKLKRIAFGAIKLGSLPRGQHRELRRDELAALLGLAGGAAPFKRNPTGRMRRGASRETTDNTKKPPRPRRRIVM